MFGHSDGADTWTYVWDQERRLAAFKKNGNALVQYGYNPTGTRRFASDATLGVENYFHSKGHVLADYDNWGLTRSYILGPSVDEIICMLDQGQDSVTPYYFLRDRLGSTRELVNASQTVNTRYGYDPWGSPTEIQLAGDVSSQYRFTGREHDPTSGLYYYGARYYANVLGRFVSRDPMCDRARKHVQGYVYVANNPVTLIDPAGNGTYTPGLLTPCSWYAHDQCVECCRARRYTCHKSCNTLDQNFHVFLWLIPGRYAIPITLYDTRYPLKSTCRDLCDWMWGQNCEDDCPPPPEPKPVQKCPETLPGGTDPDPFCCDKDKAFATNNRCCFQGDICLACRMKCLDRDCENWDYCKGWTECDGYGYRWVGPPKDHTLNDMDCGQVWTN